MVLAPRQAGLVARDDGHGMAAGDARRRDTVRSRVELAGRWQDEHEVLGDDVGAGAARPAARSAVMRAAGRSTRSRRRSRSSRSRARRSASAGARSGGASRSSSSRAATASSPTSTDVAVVAGRRLDPLGRAAQDEARRAEPGGLTLDPARIGQHGRRMELGGQRAAVAERLDDVDERPGRDAQRIHRGAGSRDGGRARPGDRHGPRRRAARPSRGSHLAHRFSARWIVANRYSPGAQPAAGHAPRARPRPGSRPASGPPGRA